MSADPKAPEVREWQGGEGAGRGEENERADKLSGTSAPSVETTVTHLARTHTAHQTAYTPIRLGFQDKYGMGRRGGGHRTPEPTKSLMAFQIRRLDQTLGRFNPKLTVS